MTAYSDVLIIGSGVSGLSFALKVARFSRVTLITKKKKADSATNLAEGGVAAVLSVLAVVMTLARQSAASKAIDEATGVSSSQSSAKDSAKNQPKGDQDMEGDLKTMHVKIVSAVRSNNDYNNQPTVLVTFEWTNNTDKNNSFAVLASPQVFQNGQALDTAIYSENPAGYDSNSDFAEVQPGATGTVTIGYTLKDDSEVTVDVTDLFDLNDSAKVVHKFTV